MIHKALSQVTKYTHIVLEKRGNTAIFNALQACKKKGFDDIYIPDVGGWITYEPYAKKLGFIIHHIQTVNGVITNFSPKPQSVLLCHSLAGYHTSQDTKRLSQIMKQTNGIFIEDCCGMIGNELHGDIVVCSFGHWKPIDFGEGGFCGTNDDELFELLQHPDYIFEKDERLLLDKITHVKDRLAFLYQKRDEVKAHFSEAICDDFGLVVLVPYSTENEKNKILMYCSDQNLEYTLCPRFIRSSLQAVCIEIKRLTLNFK